MWSNNCSLIGIAWINNVNKHAFDTSVLATDSNPVVDVNIQADCNMYDAGEMRNKPLPFPSLPLLHLPVAIPYHHISCKQSSGFCSGEVKESFKGSILPVGEGEEPLQQGGAGKGVKKGVVPIPVGTKIPNASFQISPCAEFCEGVAG